MSEYIIQPNQSLSQRGMLFVLLAFGVIMGVFALRLAYMGFWLIIPFLALDLIAVAAAFYFIQKKCCIRESVRIDEKQLRIGHHEMRNRKAWAFDLHWVRIKLQQHAHPWQPSRLLIGSHGKWIELASFLTNEERESLSIELNRSIKEHLHYA